MSKQPSSATGGDQPESRAGGPAPPIAQRVLQLARLRLYRSASALILSTVVNGLLGLAYWIIAARLYSADAVGQGAASVSALLLVSMLGWTGLQGTLIRFIPASGRGTMRLARTAYAAASAVGALCGAVLLGAAALFVEPLRFLTSGLGLGFLSAVVVWTVFSLQDGILIGLGRSSWVPAENAAFGLIKIGLLFGFSPVTGGSWAIFASWSLAAALVVVPINYLLFRRLIPEHAVANVDRTGEFGVREISRFSIGNHVSGLLIGLPEGLMPVIVAQIAGAQANAYFYAPRTVILSLRLVAVSIANALTAEGAADERGLQHLTRLAAIFAAVIFLPLALLLIVGSRPILGLFGTEYADNGVLLMRLLAIGLIPFAFTSLYLAVARVRRQIGRLIFLAALYAGLSLSLAVALIPKFDIEGAGIAWLASQTAVAGVAMAMSLLEFPRLDRSRRAS